jgi:hypothetical protein
MSASVIPAFDPTPLPAPAWLFQLLLVVTFVVHILFVNLTLGGTLLGAVHAIAGRGADSFGRRLGRLLLGMLPASVTFTITTAVAPLLFVQLLYGQLFYPATILLGGVWLGLLVLLVTGYSAVYLAKFEVGGRDSVPAWMGLAALCVVAIAAIQVLVNVLQLTPGRWAAVAAAGRAAAADPTLLPRFLHFLLGALAVTGLVLALLAVSRAARDPDPFFAWLARRGLVWALVATGLQVMDGFWFLFSLPLPILQALMGKQMGATSHLIAGTGFGVLTLILLAGIHDPVRQRTAVWAAAGSALLTVATMVALRDAVRGLYLAPVVSLRAVPVAVQGDVLLLFLAVFGLGLGTVAWMMRAVLREHRPPA